MDRRETLGFGIALLVIYFVVLGLVSGLQRYELYQQRSAAAQSEEGRR